jgi:single-stranded DNA-binding protein
VFIDAEPDWREWTDQQGNKREAVTFKARHVLFEGARREPSTNDNGAQETAAAPAAVTQPAAPSGSEQAANAAVATADDLPF